MGDDKDKAVEAVDSEASAEGGEIELRPGVGDHAGVTKVKAKIGKGTISAHVFARAALLTSAGNLVHGGDQEVTHVITRDDSITESAYEQLRVSIEKQGGALEETQEDVVALRNFLAGYLQASQLAKAPPRPGSTAKPVAEVAKLLPKADKPKPPPAPPSYSDVRQQAVDEPPLQIETKKE